MAISAGQQQILGFIRMNGGEATIAEIRAKFRHQYYLNGDHHVSERLSRMVKSGLIKRKKRGVYMIGDGRNSNPNQIKLEL